MSHGSYLVQFGRSAYVGRFESESTFSRGDRVVVRTIRGVELGVVMCPTQERFAGVMDSQSGGTIQRLSTMEDARIDTEQTAMGLRVSAEADRLAGEAGLPLAILDVEVLLEDGPVILHVLPWAECDAESVLTELSRLFHRAVRVYDASQEKTGKEVEAPSSCGKVGCGSGGGGCSTGGGCGSGGSCSKGSVQSASELTAHFLELREKMEATTATTRTPLY